MYAIRSYYARTYWPEERFRAAYASARVTREDLAAALVDVGVDGLDTALVDGVSRRAVWLAELPADQAVPIDPVLLTACRELLAEPSPGADWQEFASQRWADLCATVGSYNFV